MMRIALNALLQELENTVSLLAGSLVDHIEGTVESGRDVVWI